MAEVSLDTLEALARRPIASETAANLVSGFVRFTVVRGPFKTEYNVYQQGEGDDFAESDTFTSGLAHPMFVEAAWANADAAEGGPPSAQLEAVESSANFRRVTVHDAGGVNGAGLVVKVHGF